MRDKEGKKKVKEKMENRISEDKLKENYTLNSALNAYMSLFQFTLI